MKVFERQVMVEPFLNIIGTRDYGESVDLEFHADYIKLELSLDPIRARELGVALMDAATAVEKASKHFTG